MLHLTLHPYPLCIALLLTSALPAAAEEAARPDDGPLAGYTNGAFFLRSANNNFLLFINGRLNVDAFVFPGRGADPDPAKLVPDGPEDKRPRDTIFIRRARAEINGTIAKHFDYYLGGEFATTPNAVQYATFTDVFLNIDYTRWANVQMGQFDAPFTLENRTSDKYFDFMERSLAVRALGVPTNKELGLMVWGLAPRRFLYYSAGVFNGDGQSVKNLDSRFDFMGRAYFAPLAFLPSAAYTRWLNEIWIGGSAWYGQRAAVNYDVPALTTQGGVTLLPSTFGAGYHLGQDGDVVKWAVELNAPIGPFGLRFEMVGVLDRLGVYDKNDKTYDKTRKTLGHLDRDGLGFYVQAWYWVLGDYTILPTPGQELPARWRGYKPEIGKWKLAVFLSARYERLQVNLRESAGSQLADDQKGMLGEMTVDTAELGVNAWMTKHIRFTANYVMNYLDGDIKALQGAPADTGRFYRTPEHEVLFRAELAM